ncbi:SAM-dependent methyltransferase [Mesomycoplasma hyopneumoniae]|uniref:peptide chain release factor N(5)-glutamine methyltransferase n=2 Tax=Mesomycoplasma hyopneumoniae (strain 168) TaxID=907287 RepID=E4QSG8_MESH1|nr:peptide chain release factor N(5)-glutamine methyltransferase [Mesomycoplasma hyopneumoniae]ADQ90379.1 Protoporphyrinogen oxidase-like protein [Mesomycoplasma hyopneumoniae 168]AGM21946.1 Protoporphyrinogen oxidase-like protein [Mesomycoplasma hyopneumoniae 168-L]OWY73944.1 SAM-dependent methyltransferase [Mesomycoplasma hyopneumoniae]
MLINKRKLELLKEKQRYNLPLKISKLENLKLELDYPIQKIIGFIEMEGVKIFLDQKVFIPRYETQELILKIKKVIKKGDLVLDLCSGSGFIGLALAKFINAKITLADISDEAILQAKLNAKYNNLELNIIKSDLFANIPEQKFNIIVANPPYLKEEKLANSVLNFEPKTALFAWPNPFSFYEKILEKIDNFLAEDGWIFFEIDYNSQDFFKKNYPDFIIEKDINGKTRFAYWQKTAKK